MSVSVQPSINPELMMSFYWEILFCFYYEIYCIFYSNHKIGKLLKLVIIVLNKVWNLDTTLVLLLSHKEIKKKKQGSTSGQWAP